MLITVALGCLIAGLLIGALLCEYVIYHDIDPKKYEEAIAREPRPTRYSTEPITFAVESHHGKFVVIAKSRNDRTVVREDDLMPMADELRKHHEYLAVVNEVSGTYGVKVEEPTQNEPPDPEALPEGKAEGSANLPLTPTTSSEGFIGPTFFDFMQNSGVQRALYGESGQEGLRKAMAEQKAKGYLMNLGMDNATAARIAAQYVADAERRGIPIEQWGP